MEIIHVDEKTYLNKVVACRLHFEGYKYDQLIGKLVEVLVHVFQKLSPMQVAARATSSQNELIVTTSEEPKPIDGGAKLAIVSCTLPLPTKLVEIPIVVVNTQVEALEKLIIQKLITLIIPNIGIGIEVTLIDNIAHAFEVFKTPNIVLKYIPIIKRP